MSASLERVPPSNKYPLFRTQNERPGRSFEYIRYTASTTMTLIILFTTITAASIAATTFDNANNDNHAMKQNRKIYFR